MKRVLALLAALALPLAQAQVESQASTPAVNPAEASTPTGAAQSIPLPHWALSTPLQWQRPGRVGEPVEVQLRFAAPPEVTISFPCPLDEPPSVKVTRLQDGGEQEPLWLTLRPIWGAPTCNGGVLALPGGTRGQYRADLYGLPAGEYQLDGFWFGSKVGDTLGTPRQVLRLE